MSLASDDDREKGTRRSKRSRRSLLVEERGPHPAPTIIYPVGTHIWKASLSCYSMSKKNTHRCFTTTLQDFSVDGRNFGHYAGIIQSYDAKRRLYDILYPEDKDEEELRSDEVAQLLVPNPVCVEQSLVLAPRVLPNDALVDDKGTKGLHILWQLHGLEPPSSMNLEHAFVLFMSERARMFLRKLRGDVLLSACPLFRNLHWCNNYREHDHGTRYLHAFIVSEFADLTGIDRLRRILFPVYVYRLINRIESFEATGFAKESNLKSFFRKATALVSSGASFGTAAHQTSGLQKTQRYIEASLPLLDDLAEQLWAAKEDGKPCIGALRRLHGVGPFQAWQILCDLRESKCLPSSVQNNYCELGPGAEAGLAIIYHTKAKRDAQTYVFDLSAKFDSICKVLGVTFPYWPEHSRLSVKEIEHALCEFSKYHKATDPRTAKKRKYRPRTSDGPFCCTQCECQNPSNRINCVTCNAAACRSCTLQGKEVLYWSCSACTNFIEKDFA